MARAMNALCEILPANRMWSLGGGEKHWNLPISTQDESNSQGGLRKRISSSFSMPRSRENLTRSGSSWPFRRSQSMTSSPDDTASLRKCWDWSWGWLAKKKNTVFRKMAICDDEDLMLGSHGRSSFRQAVCKIRAQFRKLLCKGPIRHEGFTYDSFNYAQNFDDGQLQGQDPVNGKRYS